MASEPDEEDEPVCCWCYEPADDCSCRSCHRCGQLLTDLEIIGDGDDECDECATRRRL